MILKILITGSNGFLGKYVCNILKEEHELVGIGTKNESSVSGIEYHSINIESDHFVSDIMSKVGACDIIIHLAAYIDKDNLNKRLIDVNCIGSLNIVSAARELGVKKIIYSSGLPVIGKPMILPITEEHPQYPNTLYHISKLMTEHIMRLAYDYGIKYVNLRIPSPIGIGMNENTILPVMLKHCLKDEPMLIYGRGLRKQNYIDARDIAEAIKTLVKNDVDGTFNITSETVISNIELAKLCKKITESNSEIVYIDKQDPEETYCWKASIDKAKEAFLFKPKYTLKDTILDILDDWLKGK